MTSALPASCDRATALAEPGRSAKHPRWTLFATICASSLAFIDGSVVNVALPSIGASLGADAAELQWTINAYLLPLSALLLLGGAAGDHFGRKRLLIGGTGLFALASLLCAFASSLELLLAARALQGIGAAMLMPNSLAILGNAFDGEAKGKAIGTWASAGAIASAIGPPLGGWLVETIGWQAIFYLNLPVAAAAMLIAWRFVADSGEGKQALDWAGAALATLGLGALTWALTLWSSRDTASAAVWIGAASGVALLAAFLLVEHRKGERAMMPLSLFGSRPFVGLTLLTFLLYGALGGLIVLLPYVLIVGGGYSPLQAGLALLPFSIVIGSASRLMGGLTERIGPRIPLGVGPVVTGIGFALLLRVDPTGSYWTSVLPGILIIALGMAGAVAPLTTAVLSSVDGAHTGTASGFNSAIARTGGLVATALAGAVIAQTGAALTSAFHAAAAIGAALAMLAGIAAFLTLDGGQVEAPART
ncbi:MFS transporter [Allosphingosinicella deserti]|uniref:MFS transporter n=1 Tax=Allosphingosinicella deserti TaxID=2116704 RepID=A0A2P7QG34_9SPHN|nr:MFS transporter [Sphingomonas deserti]PSJ36886.1 MFS transporter [Sphingomonas deserti]